MAVWLHLPATHGDDDDDDDGCFTEIIKKQLCHWAGIVFDGAWCAQVDSKGNVCCVDLVWENNGPGPAIRFLRERACILGGDNQAHDAVAAHLQGKWAGCQGRLSVGSVLTLARR